MERYALFSVTEKTGIVELARRVSQTHKILASGGTGKKLEDNGIDIIPIAEFTNSPEMFDGRVKTLHPKIHGGILFRDTEEDKRDADKFDIPQIDLVVCNLYEFEKAISSSQSEDKIIESIDIGGPTLIRAAAKNYERVTVVVDPDDYQITIDNLPEPSREFRQRMAVKAFGLIHQYDLQIDEYFKKILATESSPHKLLPDTYQISGNLRSQLKYGENPHQAAAIYTSGRDLFYSNHTENAVSYNNILDMLTGWNLALEFDKPSCVIIKHRTPCGVAYADNLKDAYLEALETDKMSAYGGVYIVNQEIDQETANELVNMFVDVLLAPSYSEAALNTLKSKEKMKILQMTTNQEVSEDFTIIPNGFLIQQKDKNKLSKDQIEFVSQKKPTEEILQSLFFAWDVVKHSRSNAIAIAKGTRALGIGSGQTSRVDATDSAIKRSGDEITGAVMASDAFFPFPDSIEKAAKAGITAIISPKGSIRDQQVIDAANEHGIILVFTTVRSFKH